MAIDYRYHVGSLVSIFVALLLGILIGIGLAPKDPEQLDQVVSNLRREYQQTKLEKEEKLARLQKELDRRDALARETVSAVIADRLLGKRIALVLNHNSGRDLPAALRAALTGAGALVTSTIVISPGFVSLSPEAREAVCSRLLLYPPSEAPLRPILARSIAQELARGQAKFIPELQAAHLLTFSPGSSFEQPVHAVLIVGGLTNPADAMPEQIDVPLIEELSRLKVRVVGCERTDAKLSTIPVYKELGIPTVDHADTLAGRLSLVLALQGVDGHFGLKDAADRFLPAIPGST